MEVSRTIANVQQRFVLFKGNSRLCHKIIYRSVLLIIIGVEQFHNILFWDHSHQGHIVFDYRNAVDIKVLVRYYWSEVIAQVYAARVLTKLAILQGQFFPLNRHILSDIITHVC